MFKIQEPFKFRWYFVKKCHALDFLKDSSRSHRKTNGISVMWKGMEGGGAESVWSTDKRPAKGTTTTGRKGVIWCDFRKRNGWSNPFFHLIHPNFAIINFSKKRHKNILLMTKTFKYLFNILWQVLLMSKAFLRQTIRHDDLGGRRIKWNKKNGRKSDKVTSKNKNYQNWLKYSKFHIEKFSSSAKLQMDLENRIEEM